jgi:hypothetical protein
METTQPAGNPAPRAPHDPSPSGPDLAWPPGRRDPLRQPAGDTAQPRVRVGSPADVLAVVPYLLGFHPARSFVVLGAAEPGGRIELGFRYDLPDPPSAVVAAQIADHAVTVACHRNTSTVIGAGYGPGRLVTPVADALVTAARRRGLRLRELLRAEDGRYWSYLCRNPRCCPAEGVPFDYRSHPAAAALAAAGLPAYPDRGALARTLEPVAGPAARAMEEAIGRACARAAGLVARGKRRAQRDPLHLLTEEGRRAVGEAIRGYRAGGRITGPDQLAWLLVVLASLPVRDDAWARMVPEHRLAHLALWTDLVRHASGPWLPAPACLLAFTAWQSGNGTLANVALDRALGADPGYSLALLLRDVLAAGVPPSQARVPMTPEEVAASYARAGRPGIGGSRRGVGAARRSGPARPG